MAVVVLNEMQMFDQQIAATRAVGQQRLHIGQSRRINLAPLRRTIRLAAAIAAPAALAVCLRRRVNVHYFAPKPLI